MKRATKRRIRTQPAIALLAAVALLAACGSSAASEIPSGSAATASPVSAIDPEPSADVVDQGEVRSFLVEVWADNWMAVYVNGQLIGEDSVPITTERSFNAESFTFEAAYPFTIGIEAKDFKETDSGIEYIGQANQQMGDGGLIAQVTDVSNGEVVAATGSDWSVLVVQRAPLNTECADDPDPDATCESESIDTPTDWADAGFDDSGWDAATEWTANAVSPKDGYDEISWDDSAELIWGSDLEVDNTILMRFSVG